MLSFKDEVCKPTKGSKYSAAIDLYSSQDVEIGAFDTAIVPLGVWIDQKAIMQNCQMNYNEFRKCNYLQLEPRSSLRVKGLQAGTGIIDLDYPDEIKLILHASDFPPRIKRGDKVAQILLKEHKTYLLGIDTDEERVGGFGSTDIPSYNVSKEDLEYQLNRLTPKVHGDKK